MDKDMRMYEDEDFYDEDLYEEYLYDDDLEIKEPVKRKSYKKPTRKKKKKVKKKKRYLKAKLLFFVLLAFVAYLAYIFINTQVFKGGVYTVAVFGVDSRDGNTKTGLADVNMLVSINKDNGDINVVSIYRDNLTMIDDAGNYHKFNEAYFKGGADSALKAIKNNFDIDVKDYATFNWKSVVDIINILGGVDIELTDAEFKYINGFITETVKSTNVGSYQLKQAGLNHLDGVQAVAYARLRLMDTDFQRTKRQRLVMSLAFEKIKKADFITINRLIMAVLPQISTNITVDDLLPFAKNINKYHLRQTAGFPFEKETTNLNKMDFVIPVSLVDNVIELHKFLYGEDVKYTPSSKVKEISNYIVNKTGIK